MIFNEPAQRRITIHLVGIVRDCLSTPNHSWPTKPLGSALNEESGRLKMMNYL
jgi:hypothetical protein